MKEISAFRRKKSCRPDLQGFKSTIADQGLSYEQNGGNAQRTPTIMHTRSLLPKTSSQSIHLEPLRTRTDTLGKASRDPHKNQHHKTKGWGKKRNRCPVVAAVQARQSASRTKARPPPPLRPSTAARTGTIPAHGSRIGLRRDD